MLTDYVPTNSDLLCVQYSKNIRNFRGYRGFTLATLKLILSYSFSGYVLKIEKNNKEFRYDIFLRKKHIENYEEINMQEIEKFRNFYGKGFNITILSESL